MRDELTLRQISQHIFGEIFNARTDFLLRQTAFWQEINAKAKESTGFTRPESLDVTGSSVEFFIRPARKCFLSFFIPSGWMKKKKVFRFKLAKKEEKQSIRVMIKINTANRTASQTEISTDPETGLKPEEIHVAGIA